MQNVILPDEQGFERIVFAEVIIPDVPNVYGDFHTRRSVRDFAYGFMINGFRTDVEHDNIDRAGKVHVVESFIAREGDPDFIPGAWVVGLYIPDDELWGMVLNNELNGYSYEAYTSTTPIELTVPSTNTVVGTTQPNPADQHTHEFLVVLGDDGRPIFGVTSLSEGHRHPITVHTFTDRAAGHSHIYNFLQGSGGR